MRTVLTGIGIATIAAFSGNVALAQTQSGDGASFGKAVRYDISTPVSPSSATATVSPSSVPQAMERLSGSDTTADISLGTIYAGGKFGTGSKTTIWSSALGARLRISDFTLTASLPWMRIESRSTIFTGIDATPVLVAPITAPSKGTAKGFGDLTLGASYTIAPEASPIEIELSGRAKITRRPIAAAYLAARTIMPSALTYQRRLAR